MLFLRKQIKKCDFLIPLPVINVPPKGHIAGSDKDFIKPFKMLVSVAERKLKTK